MEKFKEYRCEEMKSGPDSSSDVLIEYKRDKRSIEHDFDFGDSELLSIPRFERIGDEISVTANHSCNLDFLAFNRFLL